MSCNKKSRFICLKCLHENGIGAGIQRVNQRENGHIKNLYCIICKDRTKNLEIRYCDYLPDMIEYANEIRGDYYNAIQTTL